MKHNDEIKMKLNDLINDIKELYFYIPNLHKQKIYLEEMVEDTKKKMKNLKNKDEILKYQLLLKSYEDKLKKINQSLQYLLNIFNYKNSEKYNILEFNYKNFIISFYFPNDKQSLIFFNKPFKKMNIQISNKKLNKKIENVKNTLINFVSEKLEKIEKNLEKLKNI